MDDSPNHQRQFSFAALALAVFVLYPLSLGPAVWLAAHGCLGEPQGMLYLAVVKFYAPLEWLAETSRIADRILRWYINWFGG